MIRVKDLLIFEYFSSIQYSLPHCVIILFLSKHHAYDTNPFTKRIVEVQESITNIISECRCFPHWKSILLCFMARSATLPFGSKCTGIKFPLCSLTFGSLSMEATFA